MNFFCVDFVVFVDFVFRGTFFGGDLVSLGGGGDFVLWGLGFPFFGDFVFVWTVLFGWTLFVFGLFLFGLYFCLVFVFLTLLCVWALLFWTLLFVWGCVWTLFFGLCFGYFGFCFGEFVFGLCLFLGTVVRGTVFLDCLFLVTYCLRGTLFLDFVFVGL